MSPKLIWTLVALLSAAVLCYGGLRMARASQAEQLWEQGTQMGAEAVYRGTIWSFGVGALYTLDVTFPLDGGGSARHRAHFLSLGQSPANGDPLQVRFAAADTSAAVTDWEYHAAGDTRAVAIVLMLVFGGLLVAAARALRRKRPGA